MSVFGKERDQQEERTYQVYLDQHGREWGAVIELAKRSNEPVGPIDPRFRAPFMPPQKYVTTDAKKRHGRILIDYERWVEDLRAAHEAYRMALHDCAVAMYGDQAAAKVENPTPAMLHAVGKQPEPVGPVLLAQRGDRWILGLTNELPAWATADSRPAWVDDLVRPKPKKRTQNAPEGDLPAELAFLKDVEPRATNETRPGQSDAETNGEARGGYPAYVRSAGRGTSVWKLSDGSEFTGKKDAAIEAEADLLPASQSVGTDMHASWRES